MKRLHLLALLGFSFLGSQLSSAFAQGSLTPPGPPGPTMVTLSQIEPRTPISSLPFTITNSGSYYLTTNLTNATGDGIYVTANNVSIDLRGFTLDGGGSDNSGIALAENMFNPIRHFAVHDGMLGNWGACIFGYVFDAHFERLQTYGDGGGAAILVPYYDAITYGAINIVDCVDFGAGGYILDGAEACVLQNCNVYGSGGIRVAGSGLVSHCSIFFGGIDVGSASTVSDCAVFLSDSYGILAGNDCIIRGCTVSSSTQHGIYLANNCVVKDCTMNNNSGGGLYGASGCKVTDCAVNFNTCSNALAGIQLQNNCSLAGCTVDTNNGSGIVTGLNCVLKDCVASGNGSNGISAGNGATIGGCSAAFNTNVGIIVASECTVSGCTASGNNGDGIQAAYSCLIKENTVASNSRYVQTGGAGIRVLNNGNRVEGNNANSDDYGIKADGAENIIARNTVRASLGVNYSIVAGNMVGTIVSATSSVAISGSSGGSGLGSTDPWANFSY